MLVPDRKLNEDLIELHEARKDTRSKFSYITIAEVYDYFKKYAVLPYGVDWGLVEEIAANTATITGWKQMQKVYSFTPELLKQLLNVDFTDIRNAWISRDDIQFLPCSCFYVEFPCTIAFQNYQGFFVNIDDSVKGDVKEDLAWILFVPELLNEKVNYKTPFPEFKAAFSVTLFYEDVLVESSEGTIDVEHSSIDYLKQKMPGVFLALGEKVALNLIVTLSTLLNYLAASNAVFYETKKSTKRPMATRTHLSDAEYQKVVYTLPPSNLTNIVEGAYEGSGVINNEFEGDNFDSEQSKGKHKRPHMRRAHWHYYWYGKKDGSEKRTRRRLFIPAVFIDKNEGYDIAIPTRTTF